MFLESRLGSVASPWLNESSSIFFSKPGAELTLYVIAHVHNYHIHILLLHAAFILL